MTTLLPNNQKIIIAGPCALESKESLKLSIQQILPMGIKIIRASLWKPRTSPSWEGLGAKGLSILLEETFSHNLIPATEIFNALQAKLIVDALKKYPKEKMVVWLGARNQNHLEQRAIAKILSKEPNIFLLFKNQMWDSEDHWLGIFEHILSAGFPSNRLLTCHRGFAPGKTPNPNNYRNLPDFEMAMRIKEKTQIPMLIDPSHMGGSKINVRKIIESSLEYDFDGFMIEAHPEPLLAKTDCLQQILTPELASWI